MKCETERYWVLQGYGRKELEQENASQYYHLTHGSVLNHALRVRGDFASRYEDTLARDSITLETEDATNYWVVQLARRSGYIYFQEGWSTFVQDNGLAEGAVSAPDSGPPVADCGSPRLDNVGLRFVRKFTRYALKTNLDLPNTFALAMDRRGGGPITLVTAAGSKYYASLRERDNGKVQRFYLAAGGWTEFCQERYVRPGNILLFTLSFPEYVLGQLARSRGRESYETQLLNLIHRADKFSNSMLPECGL
ncbi:hypothetical protein C2S51_015717 [Perilla frutescens var. frutescens]|nr:hypothetical protein C2S51_015717 [Perilla frutescens var. frutescens]